MINYVKIQSYIDVVTSSHNRWPCLPSMHLFERVKADNKTPQRSSLDKRLHYLKACYVDSKIGIKALKEQCILFVLSYFV